MRTPAKWLFPLLVGFGSTAYSDHPSSYMPVDIKEDFQTIMKRMVDQKDAVEKNMLTCLSSAMILAINRHPAPP